jgi:hypothetical protein
VSTEAGPAGEPPATGPPVPYTGRVTSGDAVTVNTRGVAVMDAEQQAAARLIADGVPAALMAKDPGLWGPDAAEEAATRLGWLTAPALGDLGALRQRGRPAVRLHLRDRQAGIAQLLAAASTEGVGR